MLYKAKVKALVFQQNEVRKRESNKDERLLRDITKMLVVIEDDLIDFGLLLGFERYEIKQIYTNNPRSVENAAWELACDWWNKDRKVKSQKIQFLREAAGEMKQFQRVQHIQELIDKWNRATDRLS